MNDAEFVLFLALLMVSDPWPLSDAAKDVLETLADRESVKRGYENWIVAYHEFKKEESQS